MPRTAAGATLTARHREGQLRIRAQALRDFITLWPLWTGDDKSFNRLIEATVPLIGGYHRLSSSFALQYYEALRRAERAGGSATPRLATLDTESVVSGLVVTGRIMTRKALAAGQSPEAAMRTALVRVSGNVTRHVLDGGRDTVMLSTADDKQAGGWERITDAAACDFCASLAGPVNGEGGAFEAHDHCVPGWTVVDGPSVEVGYRRWYEGELVVVRLAGGNELAITPNHPVLTERGWVEAGLLCETDHVACRFGADLASLHVPHEDDVPASIEDVWGASRMDWLRSVPVAAEDFHGDGCGTQGNVDVVAPYGLLARMLDAEAGELGADGVSAGTGGSAVADAFSAQRDFALMGFGVLDAAACGVCGGRFGGPVLGSGRSQMKISGLADAPPTNACLREPSPDDRAGDGVAVGEGLLRFSVEVGSDDSVGHRNARQADTSTRGTRFDTASVHGEPDLLGVQTDLGRRLCERLAGGIELRGVVDLGRIGTWAGHVYNLQTAEGWYDADGVIVSNCGCTAAPAF